MKSTLLLRLALLLALAEAAASGSSSLPRSPKERFDEAAAVCRGVVRQVEPFEDAAAGVIRTRTLIEVTEVFKGVFPPVVQMVHLGGTLAGRDQWDGFSPRFAVGEERLLYLRRSPDGTLFAGEGNVSALVIERAATVAKDAPPLPASARALADTRALASANGAAGEDVTDQAAALPLVAVPFTPPPGLVPPGMTNSSNGFATRFIEPDRGEAIPYLVDAQVMPAGITTNQATNALAAAFSAWSAVTGLRFAFDGFTNLGNAAVAATNLNGTPRNDAKIRVQFHDTYNVVPGGGVLAVGGRNGSYFTGVNVPGNWGVGGNVRGFEFNRTDQGYVVLEHTNVFLQDTNHLAEVLCHELGHVLNLIHSSENTNEPNTTLSNAVMFFLAHHDNRGATLNSYDISSVQNGHPPTNPPPWTFDRVMDVVDAAPSQPSVPGVNELRLQPFDLFSPTNHPAYAVQLSNATATYGTFATNAGNPLLLRYTPAIVGDGPRVDPVAFPNSSYDSVYARVSDGTNASPYVLVRVISLSQDNTPSPSDGIPDSWMIANFGTTNLSGNRGPTNDFDGDGLTNFQEYLLGSNPGNSASGLRILSQTASNLTFQSRPAENYELYTSTNLSSWIRLPIGVLAANTNATFTNLFATNGAKQFYRVGRVP